MVAFLILQSANLVQNSAGSVMIGSHDPSSPEVTSSRDMSHDTSSGLEFLGPEMEDLQQLLVSMASGKGIEISTDDKSTDFHFSS